MKVSAALSLGQVALGGFLAFRPRHAARLAAGPGRPAPQPVVRVLGGRMLAQGLVLAVAATRGARLRSVLRLGALVDAAHAASMIAVAAWKPAYRRSALASAGLAGASAATGVLAPGARR